MIQTGTFKTLICALMTALISGACATTNTIAPFGGQTDDLEMVASDVLSLAQDVGKNRVLAVFDIDNTLLAMEQDLGADQWYEWQKETSEETPCDPRVVADRLAVQGAMYFASAMQPTQENAAEIVRRIQQAGVPVIALTSRGVDFRLQTFRELRRNGFDFRRSAIGPEAGWPEDFIPDNGIRPARYEDGVFLTTGQHKGAMLLALLERTDTPLPAVVVVTDDKQANLDAVIETFTGLGVPIRAWRYTGEDETVEAFDGDQSHATWQQLLPAMETIQRVLGPDNYSLPESNIPAECDPE